MTTEFQDASWEAAVEWYRTSASESDIRANYFDLPVIAAARRYRKSAEFRHVTKLLSPSPGRTVLDLGAGNGIASYAFASDGWSVEAIEPDPSDQVGAGAIADMALVAGLPIRVHQSVGERLPLKESSVHAIHARQVLHHLKDLVEGMRQVHRVLVPGGLMLCTREHVVDDDAQLDIFLKAHPLHARYGGENAHSLTTYLDSAADAGFDLVRLWGPLETPINAHPMTENRRRLRWALNLAASFKLSRMESNPSAFLASAREQARTRDRTAGRLYTFLFRKPDGGTS